MSKVPAGWIVPDWPAPPGVHSLVTTRDGGVSQPPYAGCNVGDHVGDEPLDVAANRERIATAIGGAGPLLWLRQVHGTRVVSAAEWQPDVHADAAYTTVAGPVCTVQTADCLPVLFCRRDGTAVAAAHAGWRGLAAGILERTVSLLGDSGGGVMAWLGPAIGPQAYEIGAEVRSVFVSADAEAAAAFVPTRPGHWLVDLYALARMRLARAGVADVYGGSECTLGDPERFYSYRRDGMTGRMASLVWIAGRR